MLSVSINNNKQVFVKFPYNLLWNLSAFGFASGFCLLEVTRGCQTIQFLVSNMHTHKKPLTKHTVFFL